MPYKDKNKQREYCRNWIKERRGKWFKENGPCVSCGSWEDLEVDHEDPSKKISHRVWSWNDSRRLAELSKCRPKCKKCHKIRTAKQLSIMNSRPITHGIVAGYLQRGCRCNLCTAFYRSWRRKKYLRIGK